MIILADQNSKRWEGFKGKEKKGVNNSTLGSRIFFGISGRIGPF